eukprot:scpid77528/ scgid23951/ 
MSRCLWELRSIIDFGEEVGQVLSKRTCDKLALELVKGKGERNPDNYRDIVENYMHSHRLSPADTSNVAGLIQYYQQSKRLTGREFVEIIRKIDHSRVPDIEDILSEAEFKDTNARAREVRSSQETPAPSSSEIAQPASADAAADEQLSVMETAASREPLSVQATTRHDPK